MATEEKEVNWRRTVRAVLIITGLGLSFSGLFHFDRIDCRQCWQDVTMHFFATFGFFAAFGFAIGWTLPESADRKREPHRQWKTRHGFWEGSLGVATLLSILGVFLYFS